MSGERGTMQRGLTSGTADQAIWPEATAPAGRRLPSAPRERKPALAALALLLIVGGALGAGFLVLRSGQRVPAIEISQQVGAGQRIPLSAMTEVQVPATGLSYVSWDARASVTRYYAATTLPPGTLLTNSMVARTSGTTAGRDVLGLALKDGQLPNNLAVGDRVAIFAVSGQSSSSAGCPGSGGAALSGDASVLSVNGSGSGNLVGSSQSGATDVTVAVSPGSAGSVACNAAAGNVAVVVLPPGGKQPVSPAPSASPGASSQGQKTVPNSTPVGSHSPGARTGHG
ncbi:MAG: hypothetical protein J2P33_14770 [Actinobacteria bacterium]|nr:hypothetical protein [Actinomycetota bacterium]